MILLPVREAGILHEPPVSVQNERGAPLEATNAPDPPLLPTSRIQILDIHSSQLMSAEYYQRNILEPCVLFVLGFKFLRLNGLFALLSSL